MLPRRFVNGALLLVLVLPSLVTAQALPPGVRLVPNLPYGSHARGNLLDLYLPRRTASPAPLVLWIHGGGWEKGNKDSGWPALFLVDKGYAVASMNYRLSDEARFPAQIHDCKAAVRWLRANAGKYNLDEKHFGAWGASAGGHLAALLGASGDAKALEGRVGKHPRVSSRVQAICDWFGPTDLEQFSGYKASVPGLAPDYPMQALVKLFGGSLEGSKSLVKQANPITHVTRDSPPFLIMHGDRDTLVPPEQSQLLAKALKEAGAKVDLRIVPGAGHAISDPGSLRQVEEFFNTHLGIPDGGNVGKDVQEAKLIATYAHRSGRGVPIPIKFYSNGRVGSADSPNTWVLRGNTLVLCWYDSRPLRGVWVDTCILAKDGSRYHGLNQDRAEIYGEKTSGDKLSPVVTSVPKSKDNR